MKNSDIYVGQLLSYPILPDSEKSKDFRLGDSIFYPGGDTNRAVYLNFSDKVCLTSNMTILRFVTAVLPIR